jgi:uncharacterized protein (TIGR02271 family)
MLKRYASNNERIHLLKGLVIGAIIGGILGIIVTSLYQVRILGLPGFPIVLGIIAGAIAGSIIELYISEDKITQYNSYINSGKTPKQVINDTNEEAKLQLREEQLNISKKHIQTGKVSMHKEIITEEKNITVPITREELVIEKTTLNLQTPEETETIRIPITEERIDISKHQVPLQDVSVHKHHFEETTQVKEVLKKEKIHVQTTGNIKVINKNTKKH